MPYLPRTKPNSLFVATFIALSIQAEIASPQTFFYEGKTLRIVQGRSPGGFGDMRVKALVPFMQKYIPGHPTIVSEYIPGGGGRSAANHIFKVAAPDGLTMGNAGAGLVTNAVLGEPGVEYRLEKLIFLGAPDGGSYQSLFVTRKEIGTENLDKLRAAAGVRIGSVAVGHSTYNEGRLFAYFLDLKEPKFVTGYAGPEIDLALERGEVDARTQNIDSFLKRSSAWIDKGIVHPHAVFEVPRGNRHPRFGHLPDLETFARSERERGVLAMLRAFRMMGAAFFFPPGTPKERVEVIRTAMRQALRDPLFHREYKKLSGDDATPVMPEECDRALADLPRDNSSVELFKRFVGTEALPTR
jgi:tripartite-type tricarboxylate transporter receptor subunit TctC